MMLITKTMSQKCIALVNKLRNEFNRIWLAFKTHASNRILTSPFIFVFTIEEFQILHSKLSGIHRRFCSWCNLSVDFPLQWCSRRFFLVCFKCYGSKVVIQSSEIHCLGLLFAARKNFRMEFTISCNHTNKLYSIRAISYELTNAEFRYVCASHWIS